MRDSFGVEKAWGHLRRGSIGCVLCGTLMWAQAPFAQEEATGSSGREGAAAEEPAPPIVDPKALREQGSAPDLLRAPGLSKGVDAIIAEIRKREVELVLREQRVAERERSVVELEALIEKRAMELDRIRQEVEDRISSWTSQGTDRVIQLANVYAAMPPAKAGALLGKLDLDLAVAVMRQMKKKQSAAVMSAMRADRALVLSRRLLKPLDPTTDAPAARQP